MSAMNPVVSAAKVQQNLSTPDFCIVDCRFDLMHPDAGYSEWRNAHLPGAVYAHLDDDLSGPKSAHSGRHPLPDPQQFADRLGAWGIGNESAVVVYDAAGGAIAARCWWLLRWIGHKNVRVLDGGFANWCARDMPTTADVISVEKALYRAQPDWRMTVATDEVEEWVATHQTDRLLDARDAVRFRGDVEPIDTVAGHVPGARNLPFSCNLSADGLWRDAADVKRHLAALLGEPPGSEWAVMCGSGVTACHLALAGQRAGYIMPRLYAGSWSEWIRDPRRPVARGAEPGPAASKGAEPAST
jgi:thiosulfate/3-mercaptopyruvate sulfurtransferase